MENKRFISKRAMDLESIKKICMQFWREGAGPFENTFRLLSYLIPFIPGVGWAIFILEKVASWGFDHGLDDFGKYIDKMGGFGPNTDINESMIDEVQKRIQSDIEARAADKSNNIVKNAWGFSLLTKLIPKSLGPALKIVVKAMGLIALAWGANRFSDVGKKIKSAIQEIEEKGVGGYAVEEAMKQISGPTDVI